MKKIVIIILILTFSPVVKGQDISLLPVVPYTSKAKDTYPSVKNIVLMSPSHAIDFEVHIAQLFGKEESAGSSVVAEINKIKQKPLLIIQGVKESEKIEAGSLKVTYKLIGLKGGHKYESNSSEIANTIFNNL